MRNKIIWALLIINSVLIILYVFPIQDMIDLITKQEAGAIGIIGGVDGPTVIFISSRINWYLTVIIILEIVFITYLLLVRKKKNKI